MIVILYIGLFSKAIRYKIDKKNSSICRYDLIFENIVSYQVDGIC